MSFVKIEWLRISDFSIIEQATKNFCRVLQKSGRWFHEYEQRVCILGCVKKISFFSLKIFQLYRYRPQNAPCIRNPLKKLFKMLFNRHLSIKIHVDWVTFRDSLNVLCFCMVYLVINNLGLSSVELKKKQFLTFDFLCAFVFNFLDHYNL